MGVAAQILMAEQQVFLGRSHSLALSLEEVKWAEDSCEPCHASHELLGHRHHHTLVMMSLLMTEDLALEQMLLSHLVFHFVGNHQTRWLALNFTDVSVRHLS